MDSSRTYRFIPADIYTAGYRIVGKIMVSANGIMGTLNDTTKSYLEIHDGRLARIHMPSKLVDHFEVVRLVKSKVVVVCAARREDLGPTNIVRGGYSNIVETPARLATDVFEIEGKLPVAGRFNFATMITETTRNFIPMFDVTLTAILLPNLKVQSPGILFNREKVDLLAFISQRAKEDR